LTFAALLGIAVTYFIFPENRGSPRRFWKLAAFFAFITATHGLLDMITDGGMGVAIFSPFTLKRWFFPWTPVFVSPIGLRDLLSIYGAVVILSELKYIWLPFWTVAGGVLLY